MLESELNVVMAEPNSTNLAHSAWVADHTLLRVIKHLRSASGDDELDLAEDRYANRFGLVILCPIGRLMTFSWPPPGRYRSQRWGELAAP